MNRKNAVARCEEATRGLIAFARKSTLWALAVTVATHAAAANAQTPTALETPVDFTDILESFGLALGPVIGGVVILSLGYLVVRIAMRWMRGFVK